MSISKEQAEDSLLHRKLIEAGIYSELDIRDEKIGYKIRSKWGEKYLFN